MSATGKGDLLILCVLLLLIGAAAVVDKYAPLSPAASEKLRAMAPPYCHALTACPMPISEANEIWKFRIKAYTSAFKARQNQQTGD